MMRILPMLLSAVLLCGNGYAQDKFLKKWVDNIAKDMIAMEGLEKYSKDGFATGVTVNFLLVDRAKVLQIDNGTFTLHIDHGKGQYCTELKLKYEQVDGKYYLIFSEPKTSTILGVEREFVDPWFEKNSTCD